MTGINISLSGNMWMMGFQGQRMMNEIVWFEHSGHSPWINESGRFVEEVLRVTGIK